MYRCLGWGRLRGANMNEDNTQEEIENAIDEAEYFREDPLIKLKEHLEKRRMI